jgi:hypothetical protein
MGHIFLCTIDRKSKRDNWVMALIGKSEDMSSGLRRFYAADPEL